MNNDAIKLFTPANVEPDNTTEKCFIPVSNGQLYCANISGWQPLAHNEWRFSGLTPNGEPLYIGQYAGKACYVIECDRDIAIDGYSWIGLRVILNRLAPLQFDVASRALQLLTWLKTHRYCGACGTPTVVSATDRAMCCSACSLDFYPRISPCVITLIHRGDQCLLARNAQFPDAFYSTLAGFIEPGETPEDCLHREVFEEVGLRVRNIEYFASQTWPFPGQLMLGFFAEYEGGDITVDGVEITSAEWFTPSDLPMIPPPTALAGQLISAFVSRPR